MQRERVNNGDSMENIIAWYQSLELMSYSCNIHDDCIKVKYSDKYKLKIPFHKLKYK